jgi:putative transposase
VAGATTTAENARQRPRPVRTPSASIHGTPQVVHADRGTSMTSKTVAALLSDLEVTKSHSRPRVSNDNPYSDYSGRVIMPSRGASRRFCRGQGAAAA